MTPWGEIEAIARQKGISVARERYKQEANQLAERLQQRLIQPTPEEVRRRSYDLYLFTAFLHSWAINERRALPKDQVAGQDFIQNVWRPITNHATLARTLYPDLLRELEIINSQLPKEELDKPGFHWTEVYSKGLDQDLKAMDIVIKQLQQAAQIQE
jgi:hypothetical protein